MKFTCTLPLLPCVSLMLQDRVDSLFFFLPVSSKSQAETARANTPTTHEDFGPHSANICNNITASLKAEPFSLRRGRIMSLLHSNSLPPPPPAQTASSVPSKVSLIWRTMTMNQSIFDLADEDSLSGQGAFLGRWHRLNSDGTDLIFRVALTRIDSDTGL